MRWSVALLGERASAMPVRRAAYDRLGSKNRTWLEEKERDHRFLQMCLSQGGMG